MLEILGDLFINLVIVIASITFGNLIFRDHIATINKKNTIIISILCGILGCLLMLYSVKVADKVIVDFRCIPIILMGVYISISASLATAVIIGAARILIFGFSAASVASLIVAVLMALVCWFDWKNKIQNAYKMGA